MRSELLSRYTNVGARDYDLVRENSDRWLREEEIFTSIMQAKRPATVLDCPFGTGRWIPQYDDIEANVIGIDLSDEMLDQARKKLRPLSRERYLLMQGSIFDYDFPSIKVSIDLLACIRFLNWVSQPVAFQALNRLSSIPCGSLLIGCSVVPQGISHLQELGMRSALHATNLRFWKQPRQFVHHEQELLRYLQGIGWILEKTEEVFSNRSRLNNFYLLKR